MIFALGTLEDFTISNLSTNIKEITTSLFKILQVKNLTANILVEILTFCSPFLKNLKYLPYTEHFASFSQKLLISSQYLYVLFFLYLTV